jgi:putative SOS response-associated peptidase YedK
MCSNYVPSPSEIIKGRFRGEIRDYRAEIYPGYDAPFIHGDQELSLGRFGLVPYWSKPERVKVAMRQCYNARSETVAEKPSFRGPWSRGQLCIIPAAAIYEPRYDSGRAVRWRIDRADQETMGIAGIWERWRGPDGDVESFAMLTVNADDHPLMQHFHRQADEKRMVVILEPNEYSSWLAATPADAPSFMRQFPAELLTAKAEPRSPHSTQPGDSLLI